jgi:hypothetical protein
MGKFAKNENILERVTVFVLAPKMAQRATEK